MGVVVVNFQGTICHAVADAPAIQRALVPNGEHVEGIPPHRAKLYLKKGDVDVASLDGLDPQTIGDYYFVYVGGHEIGIENLTERAVKKDVKFKDFAPNLKSAVPTMELNASAYTDRPDRNVVSAYMELSGTLDACKTKQQAKFTSDVRRDFAAVVTMTTSTTDTRPVLFVRPYTSSSRHRIPMKVTRPTVFITNEPEAAPHDHDARKGVTELNHFLLHYRLAAVPPVNPPVPHDDGPVHPTSCPRVPVTTSSRGAQPFMMDNKPACANSSYP